MRELRTALVGHLMEAQQLLQQCLADIDLDAFLANASEEVSDNDRRLYSLNAYGLCLQKAGIHIAAVFRANEQNNVSSLGVHARVLIECAAEVVSMGHVAAMREHGAFQRVLNAQEYDSHQLLRRITRGKISKEELEANTTRARESIGLFDGKQPKKITLADRVSVLTQGNMWYDYLADCFCGSDVDALRRSPVEGGVLPAPDWHFDLAFAVILNCSLTYVCQMLLGYGAIRISLEGDSQLFDHATALFDRVRETAAPIRTWHHATKDGSSAQTDGDDGNEQ